MQLKTLIIVSATVGLSVICALGQSPINDTLVVNFPNPVRVGSQTLNAGEYTIRQLSSASNSRLLEFSTDKGTSIQASATSIPVLDNNNRNDSSVLLVERGGIPQLHRIWVKGKSYGYEFPVEKDSGNTITAASNGMRLTATYKAPTGASATLGNESQREVPGGVAKTPAAEPSNVQAQAPVAAPAPAEAPVQAQAQAAVTTPAAEPAPTPSVSTPEVSAQTTPEMPKTAMNWMAFVLSGLGLLSLGLVVRTYAHRL